MLGLPAIWHPRFHVHLALLHASLAVRLAGDLLESVDLRVWGGMLNATALLLFLLKTVAGVAGRIRRRPGRPPVRASGSPAALPP